MAVPKTTETRCTDSSVQARQVVKRLHKQAHPYIFFLLHIDAPSNLIAKLAELKRCRDGLACVVFLQPVLPVHCYPYT